MDCPFTMFRYRKISNYPDQPVIYTRVQFFQAFRLPLHAMDLVQIPLPGL